MAETLYLRGDVVAEPLVNRWYAWSGLISPSTLPFYIRHAHLKIMRSYVANPKVHAAAVKSPKLLGGPFIDLGGGQVEEVRDLIDSTSRACPELLRFCEDVEALNQLLMSHPRGAPMEPLYQRVPAGLRGYVELVYDINDQPSFRFIEPLLYRSPFYRPDLQSLLLRRLDGDARAFVLSTPRLPGEKDIHLEFPFADERVDRLFRLREEGGSLEEIASLLEIPADRVDALRELLTDAPPAAKESKYGEPDIRVRYFGHACVLIETADVAILVDPLISNDVDRRDDRYTLADLPERIDYVLVTHNHQDHVLLETLLQIRARVETVLVPRGGSGNLEDPSLKLMLRHIGFKDVRELDELESVDLPGGAVTALPFFGEHGDLAIRTKSAYLVHLKGRKVILAADSSNIESELYRRLAPIVGQVDLVFLGMESEGAPMSWLYGPLLFASVSPANDKGRRLNGADDEKGFGLISAFEPERVFVYAMGGEPWVRFISSKAYQAEDKPMIDSDRLVRRCLDSGIEAKRLDLALELELPVKV